MLNGEGDGEEGGLLGTVTTVDAFRALSATFPDSSDDDGGDVLTTPPPPRPYVARPPRAPRCQRAECATGCRCREPPAGYEVYVKETDEAAVGKGGWRPARGRQTAKRQRQQARRVARSIAMLVEERPNPRPLVAPVRVGGRSVKAVIDSGAEDTVAPPGVLPFAATPSRMSTEGAVYRAANGASIRNLGLQVARFETAEGRRCGLNFQVAEVERPLVSVAKLCDAGNMVVFESSGGRIIGPAGREVALRDEGNASRLEILPPRRRGRGGEDGGGRGAGGGGGGGEGR